MKSTVLPLLSVAVTWAFSAACGAEKYIKIDPTSGKPEYISKDDAKNVAGMPDDAKLCEIAFKPVKIPKVVPSEDGEKKQENVDGYEFDCSPSKECNETNKAANDKKAEIKSKIEEQEKIINPPKAKPKPRKKEKEDAEAKLKKLKERLAKFKPECTLKYFVGARGKDAGEKNRLTLDEIKEDKIEHVVCACQKLEIPGE